MNNKAVTSTVSDSSGHFSVKLKKAGTFLLKFHAMGYGTDSVKVKVDRPEINIGTIRLDIVNEKLKALTVSAKRLIMKDKMDRLVYDVTKDPDAKHKKMMDIMKKIPFMQVNGKNGKLKYLNDNITTILVNGKRNEMINGMHQFPMRLIKGDVMSKIEIILPGTMENPGNKPIINIKLARELPDGYAAEITADASNRGVLNGNTDIVTKSGKFYYSVNYGINFQDSPKTDIITTKENLSETAAVHTQDSRSKSWSTGVTHNLGLGATWEMSKKNNLSLAVSTVKGVSHSHLTSSSENYDINNTLISSQTCNSLDKGITKPELNGSVRFKHYTKPGSFWSLSYNLTNNKTNDNYSFIKNISGNTIPDSQISLTNNSTKDQTYNFHLWERYGNKHLLEINTQYTNRKYDDNSIESDLSYRPGLNYTQQIYRASGRYNYMAKYFLINLVLAAAQTTNKGTFYSTEASKLNRHEFNLFPSINMTFRTKHRDKLNIQYVTRTLRPNISYLNPFVNDTDPDNVTEGNPHLKSEYAHTIRLYLMKHIGNYTCLNFNSTAEFTNNAIENVTTVDDNNISTTTYANVDKKRNYYEGFNINVRPFKWFSIYSSITYLYSRYINTVTGIKNNVSGWRYDGFFSANLTKTTRFEYVLDIIPQTFTAQTRKVRYNKYISFNLNQSLFKNQLFLHLSIDEPFKNRHYEKSIIGNDSFNLARSREVLGRTIRLYLIWDFGRLNKKPKFGSDYKASDLSRPNLSDMK
jgi:hypothetical protein